MSDIVEIVKGIKGDILALAQTHCAEFVQEARADGEAFIDETKDDLSKWATLVVTGEISPKELESLVRGKRDLAKMTVLKAKGLAQIKIDRLVAGIIDSTIKRITG